MISMFSYHEAAAADVSKLRTLARNSEAHWGGKR